MISSRSVQPTDVVLLLFILTNHKSVDSLIVQGPSDTTAMVNESTYFNCSTSIRPINEQSIIWFHFPLDEGGRRNYVYDDGRIMTNYRNRFAIDIDLSSGKFNLLALRLESKDAGRYECRDDVHEDIGASAELTVLASTLVCESHMDHCGVVRPSQCDRAPDEVLLSCSVTYNGRIAPQMLWRKSGDSLKTDCVTNYNRVACNTTLTANFQQGGSVYYCELTTQRYNCSLRINNISSLSAVESSTIIHVTREIFQKPSSTDWSLDKVESSTVTRVTREDLQKESSTDWYFISLSLVAALFLFFVVTIVLVAGLCFRFKKKLSAKYASAALGKLEMPIHNGDYDILPYATSDNYETIDDAVINFKVSFAPRQGPLPTPGYSGLTQTNLTAPGVYSRIDTYETPEDIAPGSRDMKVFATLETTSEKQAVVGEDRKNGEGQRNQSAVHPYLELFDAVETDNPEGCKSTDFDIPSSYITVNF